MKIAIYARVSTQDQQTIPMQIEHLKEYARLREWTVANVYEEKISGASNNRPAYKEVMQAARQRTIDAVLVWKLDRWGRGLKELVNSMHELEELGVSFISFKDTLDLSTSNGRAMAHMLAVFATFEREQINDRVKAGIEEAKKKGVVLGRPKTVHEPVIARAKELQEQGMSHAQIGRELSLGSGTIYKILGKSTHKQGRSWKL